MPVCGLSFSTAVVRVDQPKAAGRDRVRERVGRMDELMIQLE